MRDFCTCKVVEIEKNDYLPDCCVRTEEESYCEDDCRVLSEGVDGLTVRAVTRHSNIRCTEYFFPGK